MRLDLSGPRPRIDLDALSPSPTPDQRRALAWGRPLAVLAGAGAGKTATLSLRYAVLLLDLAVQAAFEEPRRPRPDIEAVLVLTFTEKAAQEMADRCYRRLLALSRAVRADREALDRYGEGFGRALAASVDHLIDTADRARISTFHGFCARLLREFPAETGTPPGFEVLEQADALALRDEVIDAALRALLEERRHELPVLIDAFDRREGLVQALQIAVEERGRLLPRLEEHAGGRVSVEEWLDQADPAPAEVARWLAEEGRPVVGEVCTLLGDAPFAAQALRPLLGPVPADPLERNQRYAEVLDALTSGDRPRTLTHHSVLGAKRDWPSERAWRRAKDGLGQLQGRLGDWPARAAAARALPNPADRVLIEVLGAFSRVAVDAVERQRAAFDARRALDFAELQIRAVRGVLGHEGLLARLQARFRHVMVDEFQDTDEGQWALVRAVGRSRDVYVVGDAKQAIYGFRGGDVTVFDAATRELGGAPVVLGDNFRSRDALIGWFNAFFATLLGAPSPDRPAFEAPYAPLAAGREATGGTVALYTHEAATAAEAAEAEAEAVARLAGRSPWDLPEQDTPPIAVLLQRRTWLPFFEQALRRHGVAYVVAKGVGFWTRPEILDLVNTLHALATDDPISVLGALRSPLFAVPDDELFALGRGAPAALGRLGREPVEGAGPHLRRAEAAFARLHEVRDRLPVSALLREVISQGLGWHAWGLEGDLGQAEANALRLVEMAARFDSRGPDGLETVADFFASRVEAEERETEATITPTAARVVVMTVHAAKGLEFPVVIVPQMGSANRSQWSPLTLARRVGSVRQISPVACWPVSPVDDAPRQSRASARSLLGNRPPSPASPPTNEPGSACSVRDSPHAAGRWELSCKVLSPATTGIRQRVDPGLERALRAVKAAEERAEDHRLLYVAATRARDHLVLVGHLKRGRAESGSWLDHLATHHGEAFDERDGLRHRPLAELLRLEPRVAPVREVPPPPADAARRVGPFEAPSELEIPPSSLDLFAACPAKWALTHLARIPESPGRTTGPDAWSGRLAGVRGDVIHSLLEDDVADDEAVARARWSSHARAEGCPPELVEPLFEVLREHLGRASADPELRATLAAEGLSEVGFRVPHGSVVLRGQIDRLFFDREHEEWVVLDYKSESVQDGLLVAASRHERQLKAYAWAASKILVANGQPPVRRGMLYFTGLGTFWRYPEWDDLQSVERLLEEVAEIAALPWDAVEARATATSRPCDRCGHLRRGCRGSPSAARTARAT